MEERNRNELIKALGNLPEYDPPGTIWQQINEHLIEQRQYNLVQKRVEALPTYEPPAEVWNAIAGSLQTTNQPRRQLGIRWWAYAAAASVLLAAGYLAWYQGEIDAPASVAVTVSEEDGWYPVSTAEWDSEDDIFRQVVEEYQRKAMVFYWEDERDLKAEWVELNSARHELEDAIKTYGASEQLIREMNKVERERTAVVKKMAASI